MTQDKRDRIESLRAQMAAAPLMEQKLIFREQIKVRYALPIRFCDVLPNYIL